jgi:uncharacterized membrane protein YhaH (DUF805 family)
MHWFTLALKRSFEISGRSRRREYWAFQLVWVISLMLVSFTLASGSKALLGLLVIAGLIPAITVTIRRLHDINRSGWWILVSFVPIVGGLVLLVFTLLPGTQGMNDFGDEPDQA